MFAYGNESHHLARLQRGFEGWANGDCTVMTELFHAGAIWIVAPAGVLKGNYRGRDQIAGHFAHLAYETDATFRCRALVAVPAGERVFVHGVAGATRRSRSLEWETMFLFAFEAGAAVGVRQFFVDHVALERFWS